MKVKGESEGTQWRARREREKKPEREGQRESERTSETYR